MSNEDLKVLQQYDDIFTALKNGATRIFPSMRMRTECTRVYLNIFGKTISNSQWNCSHCAYKIYKQLSDAYFQALKVQNEPEPTEENRDIPTDTVANNDTTTTKRGRKKKGE